ncbi:MAG: amino acid adenylation domain-containing protein [Atopobiaceae bacterium]|nr:amino acid adenylation domain-containing protein [Atopobiaceae bacterium]MCH4213821.1 amino acid adenylation domain-containing protein [Atopobiaceae bacterium]MCH4229923.1 amino acid adenylation domain-containing protein [Atopobiaceae bacterium]MCH4275716.1 amino acid adenylation domain-containing protein [Atopobiaceae bacterium]MCI1259461.1 amino acid adenylation domain-containing protein [Atopobiaceae bacterium]
MDSSRNALLAAVEEQAHRTPDAIAWETSDGDLLTYGELWDASDDLACKLRDIPAPDEDVVVYGNKSPLMVCAFLACLKSGHAYVPTDSGVPDARVANILGQLHATCVIAVDPLSVEAIQDRPGMRLVGPSELRDSLSAARSASPARPRRGWEVTGAATQYVIFTSGSTGTPKGVEVSADDVANFMPWDRSLFAGATHPATFVNQALLSFDLSVTELVAALSTGSRVFSLTTPCQHDLSLCFKRLAASGATCWVSTPSFVTMCLADPSFGPDLMPDLTHFFFCGEALVPAVARELLDRFPGAHVVNAYGPTESTVAVSSVEVTPQMAAADELPVGVPRKGTRILVCDPATGKVMVPGAQGEIVICGDTVATGYYGEPDKTRAVFGTRQVDGTTMRTYRTGDLGHVDEKGMLWCAGRIDGQVKVNGYRIELGEVESALTDAPEVKLACVVVRRRRVSSCLEAHVELVGDHGTDDVARLARDLRCRLAGRLPAYMVPRRIVVEPEVALTPNGKIDRKVYQAPAAETSRRSSHAPHVSRPAPVAAALAPRFNA